MAIGGFEPYNTNTVEESISAGKELEFSRDNTMMKVCEKGVIYPYQSLLTRFGGILKKYTTEYTFEQNAFESYMYQPKKFCYDYYGTPELWGDLLYINNMVSAMEFVEPSIKIFKSNILDVIAELNAICGEDL